MLIHIFLNIKHGPYGGGNQFLKALKEYFQKKGTYAEKPHKADVILFNSHHQVAELIKIKRKYPEKIFIHRIDGPVFLIRNDNELLDKLIYKFNDKIADASIFQSKWSKKRNYELGLSQNEFETTIINAPNPGIFNKSEKIAYNQNRKTRIIATSWASNMSKGFETYKYLDSDLDFSQFEMTFCGNSPYEFKNIHHIKALPSFELASEIKKHDIFITASKNDPCSNSLIEALHCGLPAIGLNDGGHPEIIKNGGLVFDKQVEIQELLLKIRDNYNIFSMAINLPEMDEVGEKYFEFIQYVYKNKYESKKIKRLNLKDKLALNKSILVHKISKKF